MAVVTNHSQGTLTCSSLFALLQGFSKGKAARSACIHFKAQNHNSSEVLSQQAPTQ
jgi:hypothetical protein